MSDRVALANAIADAGIERGKAQRVASVIFDAIHDNVAVDVLAGGGRHCAPTSRRCAMTCNPATRRLTRGSPA